MGDNRFLNRAYRAGVPVRSSLLHVEKRRRPECVEVLRVECDVETPIIYAESILPEAELRKCYGVKLEVGKIGSRMAHDAAPFAIKDHASTNLLRRPTAPFHLR